MVLHRVACQLRHFSGGNAWLLSLRYMFFTASIAFGSDEVFTFFWAAIAARMILTSSSSSTLISRRCAYSFTARITLAASSYAGPFSLAAWITMSTSFLRRSCGEYCCSEAASSSLGATSIGGRFPWPAGLRCFSFTVLYFGGGR